MDILMGDAYHEVAVQTLNKMALFERYCKVVFCSGRPGKDHEFAHEMVKSMRVANAYVFCFRC